MDRNFNKPKPLRTRDRTLYIRVAADQAGADIIAAYANAEDRTNDANRLHECAAHSGIVRKQDKFDQEALDDMWKWAEAGAYNRYDAVDEFNQTASGKVGSPIIWQSGEDVD
jgi:hypothetical protein